MGKLKLLLGDKVIGSVTITDDGDFISKANRTSDGWVDPEITIELLSDNSDMLRAHEVVDGTVEIAKAMAKDCIKYEREIIAAFGDGADEFLALAGKTMQELSDDIQTGVNSGCPASAQLDLAVNMSMANNDRERMQLVVDFSAKWGK